jgi:RNA polymerase sigma factor (sigma-70 family)
VVVTGWTIPDSEQIAAVYAASGGEVWRAMLVVAGGRVDLADEATAEAFSRLCAHWDRVREPRAWLYRTGYRVVVEQLRRERQESAQSVLGEVDPTETVISGKLVSLLRGLPPDQRLAVFLAYHADLPTAEIARLTGSSAVAVRVRLHRARRSLRQSLEEAVNV